MKRFIVCLVLISVLINGLNVFAEDGEGSLIKPDSSKWIVVANAPSFQAKYFTRAVKTSSDKTVLRIWLRNDLQTAIARLVVTPDFGFQITKADSAGNTLTWHNSSAETSVRVASIKPAAICSYNLYLKEKDSDFFKSGQLTVTLTLADSAQGSFHTISYPLPDLSTE